ncbi:DUF4168 domain-containing protein [Thermoleptolyngbya sp. M55_K2018_002]|uniref:DUF4168 domain-containing protein n=1 Tax=Thermoleptolyngbya sp. M55_K2018_002 TaxID=2747808 RepID=UPI0019F9DF8E|nr:DUF4168 domain-containing protein [Thermoleptolyngbya sp. M55_K2018_002]HIK41092.1 DUF4168 domain-containing protein [Thermoleptolyngbya sp. M55_K2018_002]
MTHFLIPSRPKRRLTMPLLTGALSLAGLLLGWVPDVQVSTGSVKLSNAALAQAAVSTGEIRSYAASVLEIEPYRQQAVQAIQSAGAPLPSLMCTQSNDLRSLPRNIRQIVADFCTQSVTVVQGNGMTIGRFNEITAMQQSNPNLAAQIRQAIVEIRRQR